MTRRPLTAELCHEASWTLSELDDFVLELLEPTCGESEWDFRCTTDHYDNSLEVYLSGDVFSRPWEPPRDVRDALLRLGFSIVFWNFEDGTEIRGEEPRRSKAGPHRLVEGVGYVDMDWQPAEEER